MRFAVFLLALRILAFRLSGEVIAVGNKHSDAVTLHDTASGKQVGTIAVGHKPHEMVLSADGKRLLVANYGLTRWTEAEPGGNTITVIDVARRKVEATIALGEHHRPHGIERMPSGRIAVITGRPGALHIVSAETLRIEQSYALGGKDPHMVAIAPDESRAWVANASSGDVTVVPLKGGGAQRQIAIGGIPMGLVVSGDGRLVYATNRSGNAVAVIDAVQDKVAHRIEVPGEPVRCRLIAKDQVLLVTTIVAGDVVEIRTGSRQIVRRQYAGKQLEGIAVDKTERYVYVSAQADDRVVRMAVERLRPAGEFQTGNRPDPIVVLP